MQFGGSEHSSYQETPHNNRPYAPQYYCGRPEADRSVATAKVYERTRIHTLAAERQTVQKKTFTKWANTFLKRFGIEINDLFVDLRDGKILLRLLEILSGSNLPTPTLGRMRIHCLENVDKSLYFLSNLNVHLENVGAHDIVDGNSRITLGLIWMIILRFQIQDITVYETVDAAGVQSELRRHSKDALLLWCQMKTADYPNVDIQNFTTSWRDGLAFNALIHKHRPDLVNYQALSPNTPLQNLESAFLTAEKRLGIARLFDPEDIYVQQPDEKSIVTYVVTYYHFFSKMKSESVCARRMEKFINCLKDIHDNFTWYEVHTAELLAWILRTIQWLNNRDFPNQVEQIQSLLSEFKNYRVKEKSEKFIEKGNIEMHLFTIQTKMRALNMRIYKPSAELQLSQVNNAWLSLEKAEHSRELSLREELIKQQRMLHLFSRFERKAKLRESWINDNLKLLDQSDFADDLISAEAALKKHEALETDVCSYADRIQAVHEIADELEQNNFYLMHNVLATREKVESMWQNLLSRMRERFKRLDTKLQLFRKFSDADHLSCLIESLIKKLDDNYYGEHLAEVEELLQRHELIETEIRSIHKGISNVFKSETEYAKCMESYGSSADNLSRQAQQQSTKLRELYSELVNLAELRKKNLELSKSCFVLNQELDEQHDFIQDKVAYLKESKLAPDTSSIDVLFRRHKATEVELENCKKVLTDLFNKSDFVVEKKCRGYEVIEKKITVVKEAWDCLVNLMASRKINLMFLRDIQIVLTGCDDAESWIEEKLKLSASTMHACLQADSLGTIERLLKRHQETISNVEDFKSVIVQLKDQGGVILDIIVGKPIDNDDLQESLTNIDSSIKMQISDSIQTRLEHIAELFAVLERDVRQTQSILLDTLSLHQVVKMANAAYSWITAKNTCLELLILDDLKDLDPTQLLKNNGEIVCALLEKLEVIKRKFSELEQQMTATAEQVSCVNRLASGLLEGPNKDGQSFLLDTVTTERLISMQDHLNEAWNKLADNVEARRDLINDESEYLNLINECRYTCDWIADKEALLKSTDSINSDDLSGIVDLRRRLGNLEGDLRAIEARVEDISSRVGILVQRRQDQEMSSISREEPHLRLPTEYLLQHHTKLTSRWQNLKDAVRERASRLSTGGQVHEFLERLDIFQDWLRRLKSNVISGELPNDLQETERRLLAYEQFLQEINNYENEADELFETGRTMIKGHYDSPYVLLGQRLCSLEDDWKTIKLAVLDRNTKLRDRYTLQYYFAEASLLEVMLNQQAMFLAKEELPTTLDTVNDCLKQYEAFRVSLLACEDRIKTIIGLGRKVADKDATNRERILASCDSFENKYKNNRQKTDERLVLLQERTQLYEFYQEVEDFEDWILDKTSSIKDARLALKQRSHLSFSRIQAFEEEIEANRDRGDRVIELGQKLTETYPHLEQNVQERLDRLHALWDELVALVRDALNEVGQENREKLMRDAIQKTSIWVTTVTPLLEERQLGDKSLDTTDMTTIQSQIKEHEKRIKEYEDRKGVVNVLKTQTDALKPSSPRLHRDFSLMIDDLEQKLNTLEDPINQKRAQLQSVQLESRNLLDLTLEVSWVREKLMQLERITHTLDSDQIKEHSQAGQRLLLAQQLRRQLRSHVLEANNRRPRMKALCANIEGQYLERVSGKPNASEARFSDLLSQVKTSWARLDQTLDKLHQKVESMESVYKFLFDAYEMESWISEQELYLLGTEKPKNEQSALSSLKKHQARVKTVEQWARQIANLIQRGSEINRQLQYQISQTTEANLKQNMMAKNLLIQNCSNRIDRAYNNLRSLAAETKTTLEDAISKFALLRDVSDLESWIAERTVTATNNDLGTDLDHCCILRDKFATFSKEIMIDGSTRVNNITSRCVRLINLGHLDAADIALAKDSINEAWAELLELIATRKQLLKAAWDMHRFVNDCLDTEERICHRLDNLPPLPNDPLVSGQKLGLSALQRSQACVEQELTCFNDQLSHLALTAQKLFPRYAGVQAEQLQARHDRVQAIWQRLQTVLEMRRVLFTEAMKLHEFLLSARELISWLESTRDRMEAKERPRDVAGVESLISDHKILHNEIEERANRIEDCLNLGRQILSEESGSVAPKDTLSNSRGEVRERCVQLATGRLLVNELWRERWDRLHLLLEVRHFARDATSAETWLVGRELQLEAARRQLGDTLAETLAMLGAHYAFEQTLATADERFNALKRLTTLEIRAMEWKPEDATLREQEKRIRVREAVKEFLPTYVGQRTVDSVKQYQVSAQKTKVPLVSTAYIEPPTKPPRKMIEEPTFLKEKETGSSPAGIKPAISTRPTESPTSDVSQIPSVTAPSSRKLGEFASPESIFQKQKPETPPKPSKRQPKPSTDTTAERGTNRRASLILAKDHKISPDDDTAILGETSSILEVSQQTASVLTESGSTLEKSPVTGVKVEQPDVSQKLEHRQSSSHSSQSQQAKFKYQVPVTETQAPVVRESDHSASPVSMSTASSATTTRRESLKYDEKSPVQIEKQLPTPIEPAAITGPSIPRLEGPVIRKHDLEVGGIARSKSLGRGWLPVYLVLDSGELFTYKDYRSRREKPNNYFRNEAPLDLIEARAAPAIDYIKRPCVFRLRLGNGSEYLFQTANDHVLNRWVDTINKAAEIVTAQSRRASAVRSSTLPVTARASSLRFDTPGTSRRRSLKTFFSLRRKD